MEQQISESTPNGDDQPQNEDSPSLVKLLLFVCLTFAGFMVLNVLTPVFFDDAWIAIILMNLVIGQLTLICVWGTLVEGTFWVRLPWTILLLVISWAALCVGLCIENEGRLTSVDPAEILGLGLVWFYGFAISYIPLKLAALLFGWRITLTKLRNSDASGNHSIRDMMIGTAILAVALAIGRPFVSGDLPSWAEILNASGLNEAQPVVALFVFSMISLLVKLPCIWIALATPISSFFVRASWWIFLSGVLAGIEMLLLCAVLGSPGSEGAEILAGLVFGHMAMATTMLGVLRVLRQFGYSMSRRRKSQIVAEA